jgi:quercetin dioxygenase-like cupin family protein
MKPAYERPFRPVDLNDSTIRTFATQAMAEQLLNEEAKTGSGVASLALVRSDNLTVVLVAMQAGATLKEHQAPGPVTLVPVYGRMRLFTPPEAMPYILEPGKTAAYAAQVKHSVEAEEDSALLIIIGGKGQAPVETAQT